MLDDLCLHDLAEGTAAAVAHAVFEVQAGVEALVCVPAESTLDSIAVHSGVGGVFAAGVPVQVDGAFERLGYLHRLPGEPQEMLTMTPLCMVRSAAPDGTQCWVNSCAPDE